mmetsp:Transcript_11119/g.27347  ORF Transcript_11119/g.27347 Transcript_11119/m.27347 type:complete len:210 (-) Transcript_11119:330-959(-)|eukprot:CAMPEP_0181107220 /NCGR_PEP_ID=MMETSP1071-20121207/16962_1 /TAXON_ID=35127 /ORGANISM="Thalassiosira sp., Strain NH16" /LENGTH=209 /DNA_ID=CAMNT_0023190705 /DNA_START=76 /DNA_END=702 /DNA_ORIENTATION=+
MPRRWSFPLRARSASSVTNDNDNGPSDNAGAGEIEATPVDNRRLSSTTIAGITLVEDYETQHNLAIIYDDFLLDQLRDAFGIDFRRTLAGLSPLDAEVETVASTCTDDSQCPEGGGDGGEGAAVASSPEEGGRRSRNRLSNNTVGSRIRASTVFDPDTGLPIAIPFGANGEPGEDDNDPCCRTLVFVFIGIGAVVAIFFLLIIFSGTRW